MIITFKPLQKSHFPLLLHWLETSHVKAWWDQDVKWTPELIKERFGSYVHGFKRLKLKDRVIEKPMHAFIVCLDNKEIGYIQYYNAYDFPPEEGYEMENLPINLAAVDVFIGDPGSISRGIGPLLLDTFLKEHVFNEFDAVFVDPDTVNTQAIRAYEKAGFKKIKTVNEGTITFMVRTKV